MCKQVPVNSNDLMEFLAPAPSFFGHHMDIFFLCEPLMYSQVLFFWLNLTFHLLSVVIEYVFL